MTTDPVKLQKLARARRHENQKFRQFLKEDRHLSSEEVDRVAFQIAEEVWKLVDCAECGNCCREVSPTLSEAEVHALSRHLGMDGAEFVSKYLRPAEPAQEVPWVMRQRPCPFLIDNRCTVYESRPSNCRDYPYLDKPDLVFRTFSMIERTAQCPAAFETWEQLKVATGFRRSS